MLLFFKNYLLEKPDKQRLSWLFAHNRKASLSGLAFVFITFTALSLVDRFFFAAEYYSKLPQPTPIPFEWDSYFRLVFVPLANLGAIVFVKRYHRSSTKRLINASTIVLLLTMASLAATGIARQYYSANDYTWEVMALIVFTLTIFGMPFRNSFTISSIMLLSGVAFLLFDKVDEKVLIYNMTFLVAIWVAMIVGAFRKSELRRENYKALSLLRNSTIELDAKARELSQRNYELQQFAYASSHDLQEPLRTISNFVSILDKRLGNQVPDDLKLYMGFISKSTERMKHLIQAILEYSHIGRNIQLEAINCNESLRQVMADLDFAISESNAAVQVGVLPNITGYATEFSLLMQNLLGNAIKFRKKEVPLTIKISAQVLEKEYRFSVSDNGIGMEPKHLEKVFDLFGRLHTKDEYEGTGIGLAHCKKIVDLHGGRIWVEALPGKGSTFYFTISRNLKTITTHDNTTELHHAH